MFGGMTEIVMMLATALAAVDSVLAILLLMVYYGVYRKIRAPLSTGLMVFSAFLVAQGLVALGTYVVMLSIIPDELAPLLVSMMALEAVGFAVLLRAARM